MGGSLKFFMASVNHGHSYSKKLGVSTGLTHRTGLRPDQDAALKLYLQSLTHMNEHGRIRNIYSAAMNLRQTCSPGENPPPLGRD